MFNFASLRVFVLVCVFWASGLFAGQPNIIVILADDQGWGDLGVSGNSNVSTPNIDRLAAGGVRFDRFYVCAVCSPTRAELLTGRYHARGGVYSTSQGGERLDLDETTIAEVFKKAGYATAAYGKWHNGMQPPYHPNARGFDDYYGFCSGHWGDYFSPMLEHNGRIVTGNGFVTDDFTEHGLRFIEENKNKPFFLYLPYNTPHSPMQVPDKWWDKYKNKEIKMRHRDAKKEDIQFTRAALAMCENIDWNVGRVVEKVEQAGLSENTIIIYLSDNGPNSNRWNDGMKGKKGSVDEGGVRSPMIIKWPGKLKAGKKIEEIAGAIDLLPTLADMAGIKPHLEKPLDGVSLKPLLLEDNPKWKDRLIFNNWRKQISVRSQRYRLDNNGRLFDMENDPGQKVDISKDRPKVAAELQQAKEKWQKEVYSEMDAAEKRPITLACPGFEFTQVPARDGQGHGNIKRSSRHPNCSYFTNWTSVDDKITWDVEVLSDGYYEVELYYTCPAKDVGSTIELSIADEKITKKITQPHDPPVIGKENNRVDGTESYVKDFKPMKLGTMHLKKGKGTLELKAIEMPGTQVMDFRLLMLKSLTQK
ncbi:MAG: arylsulfatase [Phycisphaerae bacterium]|nr:arylsulfatase [Phycisphaerae bacterium]